MRPFEPEERGYVAELEPAERMVLARLADDVAAMIRAEANVDARSAADAGADPTGGGPWTPDGWRDVRDSAPGSRDPAVRRLLPAASADDEVAAEFRRLATTEIAERKLLGLGQLASALRDSERVVVPRERADAVAGALTDVRLVLAERLDLSSDADVEALYAEFSASRIFTSRRRRRGDDGARRPLIAVFLLAGLLQETLVDAMLADLRAGRQG